MTRCKRRQRKDNQNIAYDIKTREQTDNKCKTELEIKRRKRVKLMKIDVDKATKEIMKIFE
jgi:hypothetical protein